MIAQSNSQGVKRKLSTGTLPPSSSQPGPSSSQPLRDPVSYSQDLIDVDDEGEDNEHGLDSRGSRDELYCVLETKVVGIQYYNGKSIRVTVSPGSHGLCRFGWSW